jgi:hypothetical protein
MRLKAWHEAESIQVGYDLVALYDHDEKNVFTGPGRLRAQWKPQGRIF